MTDKPVDPTEETIKQARIAADKLTVKANKVKRDLWELLLGRDSAEDQIQYGDGNKPDMFDEEEDT